MGRTDRDPSVQLHPTGRLSTDKLAEDAEAWLHEYPEDRPEWDLGLHHGKGH